MYTLCTGTSAQALQFCTGAAGLVPLLVPLHQFCIGTLVHHCWCSWSYASEHFIADISSHPSNCSLAFPS